LVHARREDGTVHGIEDLPYFKVDEKLFQPMIWREE
jgi:hypothetical protein